MALASAAFQYAAAACRPETGERSDCAGARGRHGLLVRSQLAAVIVVVLCHKPRATSPTRTSPFTTPTPTASTPRPSPTHDSRASWRRPLHLAAVRLFRLPHARLHRRGDLHPPLRARLALRRQCADRVPAGDLHAHAVLHRRRRDRQGVQRPATAASSGPGTSAHCRPLRRRSTSAGACCTFRSSRTRAPRPATAASTRCRSAAAAWSGHIPFPPAASPRRSLAAPACTSATRAAPFTR